MGVAEKILAEIDRRGTNQSRLARKAGLGVTMLSNVLSGRQRLYLDQGLKLARALGVSLDYLADDARSEPGDGLTADERAVLTVYRGRGLGLEEAVRRLTADAGGGVGGDPAARPLNYAGTMTPDELAAEKALPLGFKAPDVPPPPKRSRRNGGRGPA